MPKTKISEFDVDPANNTDINSINIAEGCAPSGINNAIRQLMADLKEFQTGASGDPFNGAVNGTVGATTPNTGAFTTLSASGVATVSAGSVSAPAITTTGDTNTGIYFPAADTIAFTEGGTEAMRIDSSGNVGIGVTPSAWSGFSALDIGSGGLGLYLGGIQQNAYFNGSSWAYKTTNPATQYLMSGGLHRWNYAASGTAGAAFTYSEAMRIDSSGNVGIGTSSPSYKLDVSGQSNLNGIRIGLNGDTINASGNLLAFQGAGTERMRIDSSGKLLVGTTTASDGKVTVSNTGAGGVYTIQASAGGYNFASNAVSLAGAYYHFQFLQSGTPVGSILSTGSTTSYNTTSDYRLKNVIGNVTNAGQRIDALEPIEYDWKNGGRTRGFLAHKFAEVYPSSVFGEKDAVDANGNPVYQAMQASTSEVMADIIAELQDLRKRVAVLESK